MWEPRSLTNLWALTVCYILTDFLFTLRFGLDEGDLAGKPQKGDFSLIKQA
jgi:hypothetical protein